MEINIAQPNPPQTYNYTPVANTKESTVLPKAETVQAAPKTPKAEGKVNNQLSEEKRQALVQRAAVSFKNVFAVSDTTFAIFKDSTGQFITRFTNLRDGRITYIPEPDMLAFFESRQAEREALIAIDA